MGEADEIEKLRILRISVSCVLKQLEGIARTSSIEINPRKIAPGGDVGGVGANLCLKRAHSADGA